MAPGGSRESEVSGGKRDVMPAVLRMSGGDWNGRRRGGIRDRYVVLCRNREIVRRRPGGEWFRGGWTIEKEQLLVLVLGGGVAGEVGMGVGMGVGVGVGVNNRISIVTIDTIVDNNIVL
jgi:hypothetical protein